jgi:flavodoxin
MKTLIIYDSCYGNTEQIAQAIANALASQGEVELVRVNALESGQVVGVDLWIVGSPTQRFLPTLAINNFLKGISHNGLMGVKCAAFDTRLTLEEIEATPVLPFFVRIFGYAARPIAARLKRKGGELVASPEGFYVMGMEGPLKEGELERAAAWAKQILAAV